VGLKDIIDLAGVPTTMGSAFYRTWVPDRDAALVGRLRRAGCVVIAKLHTQEFAYGATGAESFIGPCRNPHDVERMAGGSSGGPAAAVVAGLCSAAIGTDTGGSVRIPAALCGAVGLKPTWGRISRTGVFPLAPTLDHVGPITGTVADNAIVLAALCGFDRRDPGSRRHRADEIRHWSADGVAGVRIGVPQQYFDHLDEEVRLGVETALRALEALGAAIEPVEIRGLDVVIADQRSVLAVEAHAVHRSRLAERPDLFQDSVRSRLELAAAVPAWAYVEALGRRDAAKRTFDEVLAGVDVLATPTTAVPAPLLEQRDVTSTGIEETVQSALTRLTGATNLSGHPSLSVPCGRTTSGLPVGIQLIGRYWDEAMLYRVGHAVEEAASIAGATRSPLPPTRARVAATWCG
jgi:aspartyl-tRNA(Asn)/glutamyl-tRNA(Gln) amidotransferase subunit A